MTNFQAAPFEDESLGMTRGAQWYVGQSDFMIASWEIYKTDSDELIAEGIREQDAILMVAAPETAAERDKLKDLLEEIHHAEVFFQSACIARDFIDADKWERARKEALAKIPAAIAKAKGE